MKKVILGPDTPHFSKLFDIHMIIMSTGTKRTLREYVGLLENARTWFHSSGKEVRQE
jgi:hypothetical protein